VIVLLLLLLLLHDMKSSFILFNLGSLINDSDYYKNIPMSCKLLVEYNDHVITLCTSWFIIIVELCIIKILKIKSLIKLI